jgi:large subunit ribosomal protein L23
MMSDDPRRLLRQPLITEKSTILRERGQNQYVFRVEPNANKIEIKKAIEKIFGVEVEQVRTMVMRGKMKRVGRSLGRRANWKKAYVKLKPGSKSIEYIEGV